MTERVDLHPEQIEEAWTTFEYAERILADRMNYGMVAQAMLIAAMAGLLPSSRENLAILLTLYLIMIFGLVYSLFMFRRTREISDGIHFVRDTYLMGHGVFGLYCEKIWPRDHYRTHNIPLLLFMVWLLAIAIVSGFIMPGLDAAKQ